MWERYFLVSLAVMCIANTVSRERIFKPLRARLGGKDTWAGYLISCPYCLSHWLAFALVPLFDLRLLTIPYEWPIVKPALEWFFNSILVVIAAAFLRMIFFSIDDLVGVFRRFERIEEDEIERRRSTPLPSPGLSNRSFYGDRTSGSDRPPQ
jgi:hypothetical protein